MNIVGMAMPQGWGPGYRMGLFHCEGVSSASALASSTARVCPFAVPASQLLSAPSLLIAFPRSWVKEIIPSLAGFFLLQDSTAVWSFFQASVQGRWLDGCPT